MVSRALNLGLVLAVAALFGFAGSAMAAPADLDPTFGGSGHIYQRFGNTEFDSVAKVLVQPDGKIVIAGNNEVTGFETNQLVARFNPDGSPDLTFGSGGFVQTDYVAGKSDTITDAALMPDGRIVTVGSAATNGEIAEQDSTITRYLPSGAPDNSFSGDGKLRVDFWGGSTSDIADAVAVSPDGKVLVVGNVMIGSDVDIYAQRFTADGSPDPLFDSGTAVYRNITDVTTGSNDYATAVVQHADGTFVALASYRASVTDSNKRNAVLIGFEADGGADSSFGTAGRRIGISPSDAFGYPVDLIEQPDGKLAVLFSRNVEASADVGEVIRWNAKASSIDSTFGVGGIAVTGSGVSPPRVNAFTRAADGGFYIVGDQAGVGNTDPTFLKVSAGGALDPGFGIGGVLKLDMGITLDSLTAVATQPDGKLVGAGSAGQAGKLDYSALLVRLAGDYVPPVPLSAKIKSPSKKKMKASKLKSISGTAEGTGLAKVRLAIQKLDPKLLKKSKRCRYVTGSKGKTKKVKTGKKKKCAPKKFLTAKGTTNWSYKIKLKPGKYKLLVQAVGADGAVSKTATKSFTLTR